jgi:uncharacterized Tic20 family protein
MNSQTLSKNLLYQRQRKGFSQEKLAELSGVTVRTIQRIERGEVNSHINTLKLLADALQVRVEDLLPLDNPKHEAVVTKWLLLLHSVPLLGSFIPLTNILVPIFLWVYKRDDNPTYDRHGRAVLNFQLTITAAFLILLVVLLALPFLMALQEAYFPAPLLIAALSFIAISIMNTVIILVNVFRVLSNRTYWYPFSIPFFRKPATTLA